jgi:hypothetical protein
MATTTRLGDWQPTTIEDRIDRLESLAAIRQLPSRYALALDSRDMDSLVGLFLPNVRVGREATGRDALKRWFMEVMSVPRTSVHMTANHVIDFDDADHAHGIVYCHDELERPLTGEWELGKLQYWDRYERVDGEWYFARRRFLRWYLVDALRRPGHGAGVNDTDEPLTTELLPDAFDTWAPFWEQRRAEATPEPPASMEGGARPPADE